MLTPSHQFLLTAISRAAFQPHFHCNSKHGRDKRNSNVRHYRNIDAKAEKPRTAKTIQNAALLRMQQFAEKNPSSSSSPSQLEDGDVWKLWSNYLRVLRKRLLFPLPRVLIFIFVLYGQMCVGWGGGAAGGGGGCKWSECAKYWMCYANKTSSCALFFFLEYKTRLVGNNYKCIAFPRKLIFASGAIFINRRKYVFSLKETGKLPLPLLLLHLDKNNRIMTLFECPTTALIVTW